MTLHHRPEHVAVVGAGMVGLSVAWFLQEHGVEVTVVDRQQVGAGSSWGNAGWLTPGLSTPLPEPAVLRYGVRAVLSPASPVYVPPTLDPGLISFLTRFSRNCTTPRWARAMEALVPINRRSLAAFDILDDAGIGARTQPAEPFLAAFRTEVDRTILLAELETIHRFGQGIGFEPISGAEAREREPLLSDLIGAAILLHDQRFIDPGRYVEALAASVVARGGRLRPHSHVERIIDIGDARRGVEVAGHRYDAAVIAAGTWFGVLARPFGVRTRVQAGRGYSFSVRPDPVPTGPVYFPVERVACTPLGDRLRIAGMMEFRRPEARLDQRRIRAIADATAPMFRGIDLDRREDEWVGSRPCTPDGLPLIGVTESPRVFAAGGHSMWGITLGPVTGELLAEQIVTGDSPTELAPFDPLR